MYTLAINHIKRPAGAATDTARPSTNKVRSNIERTITLPTWGTRYGGSSSAKEEGIPLSQVTDKSHDIKSVMAIPKSITAKRMSADKIDWQNPLASAPVKNIVIMLISVGKRPLHGTKVFVSMAISRSRGESIMRHPVTPHALQPNPIHM